MLQKQSAFQDSEKPRVLRGMHALRVRARAAVLYNLIYRTEMGSL